MKSRALSLSILLGLATTFASGCVYRIDVPQGNYIEQKQIDKLQIGMSKDQVKFVLGNPVIVDTFNDDKWYYVYNFKSGRDQAFDSEKKLVLTFEGDVLAKAEGDFEIPESFYTPIQ
ncbi:outer membrane protein assembly factor BamE [Thalassotalea mangrovi]|uniref:Outer membrane protein assembly factor BamE n=1 Tax=Thalassotalea mangrovi TaxID=2572245 RepID=A0A4U1B1I9_9GAMM|nr:outer membrane protein assembly factor BamE [Thalassotalea mangrovi]TKB43097.1 outer membrane protein assembly factor BamE [Thalassotalea mangrovi]